MENKDKKKLYTAEQLAEILQMHPESIRRLGRKGVLRRVKVGTAVRFEMPDTE